jgi:hypothetical protein
VLPGWIEPVNLYLLIALPSGTRKSVVFDAATAPLVEFELEQSLQTEEASSEAQEQSMRARLRLVVAANPIAHSLGEIESVPREPWRVFVSDATPERVASLLAENGGRLAVLSDEGEICSVIAGRYGGNFEVFLKAHSGTVLTIERQGRPRVHVRKPALTLGLAVQPDVLHSLIAKRAVRERGLLARFLVAVPSSNVGYRTIAPPPVPERVAHAYVENIRALLDLPDQVSEDGDLASIELRLGRRAQELFTSFEAEVEEMLRPEGALGTIAAWGSKLCGAVARIAGLLWTTRHRGDDDGEIDPATTRSAIAIGRYLIPHALAAFEQSQSGTAGARIILDWIKRNGRTEFSRREVHQALRSQFLHAGDLDQPLETLKNDGYLRRIDATRQPGRPSVRYIVNPTVHST